MKKLMIAAAIVCAAAFAQAGTVKWASGALKTAASATGGWSDTAVNTAGALVNMSIFMVSADDWTNDGVASMSQSELYDYVSDKSAAYTAVNKNASGSIIAATTAQTTALDASTWYYSIATAEYTDANFGDMYMASAVSFQTASNGDKNNTLIFSSVANWQAVPEPTSGLLLLLGVAGLALKRKRA